MSDLQTHDVPDAVDPASWDLSVTGRVARPLRVDAAALASLPFASDTEDFACVEGWEAAGLSWRGVRVETLLERAEPAAESEYGLVRAMDGEYACAFPLDRLAASLLAVELDGDPLPVEHGGPARLVPVDDGTDCWEHVKWVDEIVVSASRPTDADTAKGLALSRVE